MKLHLKIALVVGALALAAVPAMAIGDQPAEPGHGHGKANGPQYAPELPGPGASLPEKAKAYGVHCRGKSKKHVPGGEPGTEFSRCVTAMAKAATNKNISTSQACKGLSKKHVKGEKGTEFSRCVVAAAKLRKEAHT
jgi:hypothetical protein